MEVFNIHRELIYLIEVTSYYKHQLWSIETLLLQHSFERTYNIKSITSIVVNNLIKALQI